MGELVPGVRLKAAILGFPGGGDHVLEVIEYPGLPGRPRPHDQALTDHGLSHVGLVCDDIVATRARLEAAAPTTRFVVTEGGVASRLTRAPLAGPVITLSVVSPVGVTLSFRLR